MSTKYTKVLLDLWTVCKTLLLEIFFRLVLRNNSICSSGQCLGCPYKLLHIVLQLSAFKGLIITVFLNILMNFMGTEYKVV